MKKYLILAAAAVVATAACTKNTLNEEALPDVPVTFQAANYVPQTKAGEVSVLDDFTAFKCKAYLHAEGIDLNANGTVNGTSFQNFFGTDGETITWNSTAKEWAPSHVYYWPKGAQSFVNFVGWYGVDGTGADTAPTITYAYDGTASKYKATLVWNYTSVAGNSASNLLYADMAWRFKANNINPQYGVSGASEGVPMLFHHALAQINVKAYAEGTNDLPLSKGTGDDAGKIMDTNAKWDITLKNVKITPVYTAGTLTLTNVDPGTTATTQAWTGSWSGTGSAGNLTFGSVYKLVEVSKLTAGDVIDATCVLPQALASSSVVLSFDMDIVTTYADDISNREIISISIPLSDFGTSNWVQNHKYTYYVKFVPSQNSVLFDPALDQAWTETEGTQQNL